MAKKVFPPVEPMSRLEMYYIAIVNGSLANYAGQISARDFKAMCVTCRKMAHAMLEAANEDGVSNEG